MVFQIYDSEGLHKNSNGWFMYKWQTNNFDFLNLMVVNIEEKLKSRHEGIYRHGVWYLLQVANQNEMLLKNGGRF